MRYLFICLAALLLFAAPAFAVDDRADVTVAIPSVCVFDVTGADLTFNPIFNAGGYQPMANQSIAYSLYNNHSCTIKYGPDVVWDDSVPGPLSWSITVDLPADKPYLAGLWPLESFSVGAAIVGYPPVANYVTTVIVTCAP